MPIIEFNLWIFGVVPTSFFIGYIIIQKEYAELEKEKIIVYGLLIIGIVLLFIPLLNIGTYLYRGFEYYQPRYMCVDTPWFLDIFPIYYFIAIPGICLIIYAFVWSVKNQREGEK
ncbi:MAG: hypothetical protein ACTSQJ_02045 [Promethearchaeota archaeon]